MHRNWRSINGDSSTKQGQVKMRGETDFVLAADACFVWDKAFATAAVLRDMINETFYTIPIHISTVLSAS
jgi:hypothetical protein